jgi:putative phosphoribosyl transferase
MIIKEQKVHIPLDSGATLHGLYTVPDQAIGFVLFVHGSGSSRLSPRNLEVSKILNQSRIATLLFDLLTEEEEEIDHDTLIYRFDIPLLTQRLIEVTKWSLDELLHTPLPTGYFGASTGAAAALIAAAEEPGLVDAIVSRGGRPDLAENSLPLVKAPVLLLVGEKDPSILTLNQEAFSKLKGIKQLQLIPKATHLFEEPGALESVSEAACQWFLCHFKALTQ